MTRQLNMWLDAMCNCIMRPEQFLHDYYKAYVHPYIALLLDGMITVLVAALVNSY